MRTLVIIILSTFLLNIKSVDAQVQRNVDIAGLLMDTQNLKPVPDAKVYDEKGQQVAITNTDGYFKATFSYQKEGEIEFGFKIEKSGYTTIKQHEHWGDLHDKISAIYYLGFKQHGAENDSFEEMETNIPDLSFESVSANFKKVKADIDLGQKIEAAKRKNDNVFFEIDNDYYIVNNFGWIKLKTKEDKILLADGKVLPATQINTVVKRRNVKGMTPIVSDAASFQIN